VDDVKLIYNTIKHQKEDHLTNDSTIIQPPSYHHHHNKMKKKRKMRKMRIGVIQESFVEELDVRFLIIIDLTFFIFFLFEKIE